MKNIFAKIKQHITPLRAFLFIVAVVAYVIDEVAGKVVGTYSLAMSALAADRDTTEYPRKKFVYPVAAATQIFAGSAVAINADGFAVPVSDAAGLVFVGRALSNVNNTGLDGAALIEVDLGVFDFDASTQSQANVGDLVYFTDDHTVAATSDYKVLAGIITEVRSASLVFVDTLVTPILEKRTAATVAAVATANADDTYGTPEATLINELKTQVNALLAALKAAGLVK